MAINKADFKTASNLLPKKIEQVFDQPKVGEMINALKSDVMVKRMIEFELIQLAKLMSVGGNLNEAQVLFIAEQLIDMYHNESIADFKLCFQRGAIGLYGDIQRLDGITIGNWMKSYLDEKYEVLENQLMKEKESIYKPVQHEEGYDADKHSEWLKKLSEACGVGNKVPSMTEKEIRARGKEDVKKRSVTAGYTYFKVRGVQVYASTQEHAEELVQLMLDRGELEEDI